MNLNLLSFKFSTWMRYFLNSYRYKHTHTHRVYHSGNIRRTQVQCTFCCLNSLPISNVFFLLFQTKAIKLKALQWLLVSVQSKNFSINYLKKNLQQKTFEHKHIIHDKTNIFKRNIEIEFLIWKSIAIEAIKNKD